MYRGYKNQKDQNEESENETKGPISLGIMAYITQRI
jgi:hypothetical protein